MKYLLLFLVTAFMAHAYGQNTHPEIKSVLTTNIKCNGDTSGSISVTASGGSGQYQYSDNGGKTYQTQSKFIGLKAGTYFIRVRDSKNTTSDNSTVNITEPLMLTATCSSNNLHCNGDNSGVVNVTATGGTMPYSYSWNNSSSADTIQTGLSAGSYWVMVTDANGCSASCADTITEPEKLIVHINSPVLTCTNNTGTVWVDTSNNGGTPPYAYSWDDSSQSPIRTGLGAGTYTVRVTDIKGCSAISSVTLTQQGSSIPKYNIGDSMQCGYVFYVDTSFDSSHPCAARYLICAYKDQSIVPWFNNTYSTTNATNDFLFDKINADKIISVSFAANACASYVANDSSCTGWYLPSKTELNLIYTNLASRGIGRFKNVGYWSSIEATKRHTAWMVDFFNGRAIQSDKSNKYPVRAVKEIWIENNSH